MFDVTSYGAVGDGTTDDRSAIQDAIDACGAAGGGIVFFPKGVYLLDSANPVETGVSLVIDSDNVTLEGLGRGNSIIKLGEDLNISLVNFSTPTSVSVTACGIRRLEIDGNMDNQTANSHGIRAGGSTFGLTIQDMFIHHTSSYGIGLQHDETKDCTIDNVLIEDTGADGIDVKNDMHTNINNKMSNVTVRRAGLRDDLSGQACIDIRGIWNLNNITCLEYDDASNHCCVAGIRFRPSGTNTGAHYSTLTNFYIESGSTSTNTYGLDIGAQYVAVAGGVIQTTKYGVRVVQKECMIGNVIAKGCLTGFWAVGAGEASDPDRVIFNSCIAQGCSSSGFQVHTTNVVLADIVARSNVHGVNLRNGSVNTIISGVSNSNSGNNLNKESGSLTWTNAGFVS